MTNDRDEPTGLPTASDRIFEPDAGSHHVWASDWDREHDWYHHLTGYKDAADVLLAHLGEAGHDARKLGPPIAFLSRHHLGLALKQLVRQCRRLLGRDGSVPLIHELDHLWQLCLSMLLELSPSTLDAEEVKHTTRLIDVIDPTSETFRYPEDRAGYPSLSTDVELNRISEVVGKISLLLECIETELDENWRDAS